MSNALLTPDTIAAEALIQLENNLVMGNLVYRDLESNFEEAQIGSTVRIRRPVQFTVRSGATAAVQDVEEGNTSLVVNNQKGVDFQFLSSDLSLSIDKFSERYITPAMIQISNKIDADLLTEATNATYNWVGTAGTTITTFQGFAKGPERLDIMAVPDDGNRNAVLCPTDKWGLVGGFANGANFFQPDVAKTALTKAKLPVLGNVNAYASQNVVAHTVGALGGTPAVNGANQNVTYASCKTTWTQSLITNGWTAAAANRFKAGDVFTIAGVNMVNPVSKVDTGILQQFTVTADAASDASGNLTATISPPMIITGPYQTVTAAPSATALITVKGTASTAYNSNLVFHKNAFALACVPMVLPDGAAKKGRYTRNGFSVRLVCTYDGVNDLNFWRFDVLYGVKCIDPRLATRLSGT
jgi:hypothetical protein